MGRGDVSQSLLVFTAVESCAQSRTLFRYGLILWLAAVWSALGAHGLERVNLRNGFSYDCARQESLDSTHVRLFLASDGPENAASPLNYVDLPTSAIATVEAVPELPRPAPGREGVPSGVADVHSLLAHAGALHNVDVELLASVVHAESGGRAAAVSRTGAQGLMQLMPGTAHTLGVADAFQPDQNISGGTAYLDALLTRYHDNLALALAAYNAGPAAVDRYRGIPPYRETRAYVARVMLEFKRRKLALQRTGEMRR